MPGLPAVIWYRKFKTIRRYQQAARYFIVPVAEFAYIDGMAESTLKSMFDHSLSEPLIHDSGLTKVQADKLYLYFKHAPLFRWHQYQNDCEDRANAACILLDSWNIPNYKAWVFSGSYLNRNGGSLRNTWKFHVAPLIALKEGDRLNYYVIDPAMLGSLDTMELWADKVTEDHGSAHFVTNGDFYIFSPGKLHSEHWFKRNRQNYKWTIQGLAGINGVSSAGKAQLCFCKRRINETEHRFRRLLQQRPEWLDELSVSS